LAHPDEQFETVSRIKKMGRILSSLLKNREDFNKYREIITALIDPLEIRMGELSPLCYFQWDNLSLYGRISLNLVHGKTLISKSGLL